MPDQPSADQPIMPNPPSADQPRIAKPGTTEGPGAAAAGQPDSHPVSNDAQDLTGAQHTSRYQSLFARAEEASRHLVSRLVPGVYRREVNLAARPSWLLELYSYEGSPACRRVRAVLSELDLDYIHRSCPRGGGVNRRELLRRGGKLQVPFLIDPNTGVELYESRDIIDYLLRTYGGPGAQR